LFDPRAPSSTAITGARGEFELARLASGDYTVLASGRDGSEAVVTPVRAGTRNLAIVVDPAGRIDGRLVGFTSEPVITGIILGASRFSNNPLDAQVDGVRFQASGLSPGTYVLMAVTGGGEGDTQEVIVRPGQASTVTMTSRGTASAIGKVLDHRTRAPVAGLRCNAATRSGDKIGAIYSGPDSAVISDAKGVFRIERVPAGEIVVVCGGNARSSGGLRLVTAPRDQTIDVEVFTIARTGEAGTIDARFEFLRTRIEQLTAGGAAERAGLAVGDEVLAVDGASVAELDARTTMLLITQRRAGSTATLAIRRGGETRNVAVTVRADDL
jgi:membrane-associated protease RseP (regulator of RpoE activity)